MTGPEVRNIIVTEIANAHRIKKEGIQDDDLVYKGLDGKQGLQLKTSIAVQTGCGWFSGDMATLTVIDLVQKLADK